MSTKDKYRLKPLSPHRSDLFRNESKGRVVLPVVAEGLRAEPVIPIELTPGEAVKLAHELLATALIVGLNS